MTLSPHNYHIFLMSAILTNPPSDSFTGNIAKLIDYLRESVFSSLTRAQVPENEQVIKFSLCQIKINKDIFRMDSFETVLIDGQCDVEIIGQLNNEETYRWTYTVEQPQWLSLIPIVNRCALETDSQLYRLDDYKIDLESSKITILLSD